MFPLKFVKEDAIPLLNRSFPPSFGDEKNAKKALCELGLFPANGALLSHPDTLKTKKKTVSEIETNTAIEPQNDAVDTVMPCSPSSLNMSEGFSSIIMDRMMQNHLQNGGKQKRMDHMKEGNDITKNFKEARRLTSGLAASNCVCASHDKIIWEKANSQKIAERKKERDTAKKERRELLSRITKVMVLRGKKPNISDWSGKECRIYIQYKKMNTDPAMPTAVSKLRERCHPASGRTSPTCSPHASDDEEEEEVPEQEIATVPVMEANL